MTINVKITIITPVLNGGKHIEQTIQSVLNQGYPNIEYVIIDGNSTDNTVDIIKKYRNHLAYWESSPDSGMSEACNKALKKATGEVVGIINADDYYSSGAINSVICHYVNNPEFDIFYGRIQMLTNPPREWPDNPLAHSNLFKFMSIAHPSVFVTKQTYERIGGFNSIYKLALDYEFLLRCILSGSKFKFIDEVLAYYRVGGITTQYYQKSLLECEKIRSEQFAKFGIQ